MSRERNKESSSTHPERPEKVICGECGKGFNLLHRSHLRVHGYNSQLEYRHAHNIGEDIPLNSQEYSDVRRRIQERPFSQALSSLMGKDWQLKRRVALVMLEREDFYTPRRTAEITLIPLQTIYSAIRRESLPSTSRQLFVSTDHGLVVSGDSYIRGIKLQDMLEFAKQHKPKHPRY